jgi:hypothetical protein
MSRKKLSPPPRPFRPFVRPTPPVGEARMLGEPAGRIPIVQPKKWDPMIMVGDTASVVHAVPTGARALCGYESATGWQWARGQDVTCEQCWRRHLEEELEKDRTVRAMRKWGFTGPITRQDYLDFIHATDDPQEPSAELESMLPQLLQDWSQFH